MYPKVNDVFRSVFFSLRIPLAEKYQVKLIFPKYYHMYIKLNLVLFYGIDFNNWVSTMFEI